MKHIHSLFECSVTQRPYNESIVFEGDSLTYDELNKEANKLANHLRKIGIKEGVFVGLLQESSVEVIISILAILKAGGSYVPINPMFPEERIKLILEDTRTSLILTIKELKHLIPDSYDKSILSVDEDCSNWQDQRTDNLNVTLSNEAVAYVAYTSGSTGKPKGVMVMHQGTVNFLNFLKLNYPINSDDICLQMIPFYFNGSVREVFGTLVNGAKLLMIKQPKINSADTMKALISALKEHEVTLLLSMVPAILKYFIKELKRNNEFLDKLKLILIAGEKLYYSELKEFDSVFSKNLVKIYQYGLTESSGVATYYEINSLGEDDELVSIGKPIEGDYIYLLDENQNSIKSGETGEIYIGGKGVSKGYLNNPSASKDRFIMDPFQGDPEKRLCKTGDLASFRPDGNIVFVGRNDDMIVFDGYRIEIGEVEKVLNQHPDVLSVVVIVYEDDFSNKYLDCFYIKKENTVLESDDFLIYSKKMLPYYMIPSGFIEVNEFPLKPNGKVDKNALADF